MPVLVSLIDLVSVPGTRKMWPPEFDELVRAIEKDWEEKTVWGATADWLEEDDRDESLLASGFRYVVKLPTMPVYYSRNQKRWSLPHLPHEAGSIPSGKVFDDSTPAGAAAELAVRMMIAVDNMKRKLESWQ